MIGCFKKIEYLIFQRHDRQKRIMEENTQREPERAEEPDKESNRAMLPLLQLPSNQHSHRITNFYIDNILRPDFGGKRKVKTLFRDGESLRLTTGKEELRGRKSPKRSIPHQGGAGRDSEEKDLNASEHQRDTTDAAVEGSRGRCLSAKADSPPDSKPMLWPAWVYCTRYSDRPSSGWCKLFNLLA